jgi:putative transposase
VVCGAFTNPDSRIFITFSCYRRQPNFVSAAVYDLFPLCLEDMRRRFAMRVYGYVVMPEHVHLLLSEPEQGALAQAIHYLKFVIRKTVALPKSWCPRFALPLGEPGFRRTDFVLAKTLLRPQRKGRSGVRN